MINNDRIVPVQKIDLLSLVGMVLEIANVEYTVLKASTIDGAFTATQGGILLADQPVKSLDFADGVSTATVYFIPAYDFEGFKVIGAEVQHTGEVNANGADVYKAVLSAGAVEVTPVTPVPAE